MTASRSAIGRASCYARDTGGIRVTASPGLESEAGRVAAVLTVPEGLPIERLDLAIVEA